MKTNNSRETTKSKKKKGRGASERGRKRERSLQKELATDAHHYDIWAKLGHHHTTYIGERHQRAST